MLCTLFLSAPAFAQQSTAQPVIQKAQAENDVTIPAGAVQIFDAANGEIKFDGTLNNKGTIIIRSSDPAQSEAVLRARTVNNEGKIVSEVANLTIKTERVLGVGGEVVAPENVAITAIGQDLLIANGTYRAKYFRPTAEKTLTINARRIDAQVDLQAYAVSIGVREGNLDIIKQKLDGDPIYYNRGGNITAVMPSNGEDIYVLASGDVTLSNVNTGVGPNGQYGLLVISAGLHFANPVDDGNSVFGCGQFGASCAETINQNSGPGGVFEGAPGGPFPPAGTITLNGARARGISLGARDIIVNGDLFAVDDPHPAGPHINLTAGNSITVSGTLKTDPNVIEPNYGSIYLNAPTINVSSKITSSGSVFMEAFENSVASTGSITTGAIEASTYIYMNGGHIIFGEVGGGLLPSALPHDSGEFTIKTGKLTAHRYVMLSATGNIDAGQIELLPLEANVPLGTHDIRIHANVGKEDASPLKIGGGTNGAASLTLHGTTDLGPGLTQKTGVIFLTNGPNGDIVLDGSKIHITNEHEGTPSLIAYAGTGQITVKGDIKFDGTATAPAGQILLVGDEIRSTGATISAKDTLEDPVEKAAKVVLATSKLTLAGNLTIEVNSKALTSVRIVPKGSITLDPQEHFEGLYHYVDKFPVNVTDEEVLVAGAGNFTIKAKSDGAKVDITAKSLKFNNGNTDILADGFGSQINIDYTGSQTGQNTLILSGGTVTFDASNSDGDAGDINVRADKIRADDGVVANLLANSKGSSGMGGNVTITARAIRLFDSPITIDASALSADGSGGTIDITAGPMEFDPATLKANGVNDGFGGSIRLNMTAGSPVFLEKMTIEAKGGDSGDGGTVIATNTAAFDVNKVINVDSGSNSGTNVFGGSISLNGVTCRQWKTNFDWPKSYWACNGNDPPSAADQTPAQAANTLPGNIKSLLGLTHDTHLYTFTDANVFNDYFTRSEALTASGATFQDQSSFSNPIYVAVFQNSQRLGGYAAHTTENLNELTQHEIGHAIDFGFTIVLESASSTFRLYSRNDFLNLDYAVVGATEPFPASIKRDPCVAYLNQPAPFDGVISSATGLPMCTNGQILSRYANKSNSAILLADSPGIFGGSSGPGGTAFVELHAQTISFQQYAQTLIGAAEYFSLTANGVFANGFFPCTRGWADNLLGTSGGSTAGCSNAIPSWYTFGQ
jgi:hypothetical protein